MEAPATPPDEHDAAIRAQLERMLAGETFKDAQRSRQLLRFVVEAVLDGRGAQIKEYTLGAEALDRGASFDPKTDAIARVEASRLRTRLTQYYATEGLQDEWQIVLPKGTYVPEITQRQRDAAPVTPSRGEARQVAPWILSAVLATALVATGLAWLTTRRGNEEADRGATAVAPVVHIDSGADVEVASEVGNDFALARTGRRLVFVGRDASGSYSLFARDMTDLAARELPGTRGARVPALSPDGEWVAYWAGGELWKTRFDATGRPVPVLRTADALGIDWIDGDTLVVGLTPFELARVDLRDGSAAPLVKAGEQRRLIFPQSLQGGALVLGTSDDGQVGNATVELLEVATGRRTVLMRGAMFGRYTATGHLLFVRAGALYAVKLDLASRAVHGEPQLVIDRVAWSPTFAYAQYAVADDGLLLVRQGGDGTEVQAGWIRDDGVTPLPGISGLLQWPKLSPDGKKLAVMRREAAGYDLWLYDLDSGMGRKLADQPDDLQSPVWTPDGQTVIYAARTGGIWWSREDRSGVLLQGTKDQQILVPTSVSPDARWLAWHARGQGHPSFDLWVAPLQAGAGGLEAGAPRLFRSTDAFETYATFSPDGRWIAYSSNESGRWEVYVRSFPDEGPTVMVSAAAGRQPVWDPRGKRLFFLSEDRRLVAAEYAADRGRFAVRTLRPYGNQPLADTGVIASYDVGVAGVLGFLPLDRGTKSSLILFTDFRSRLAPIGGS